MSFVRPDTTGALLPETTEHAASVQDAERRRHCRLPVTLSARVHHAERSYRTRILDVSAGGLLLSPIAALSDSEHQAIHVESVSIGKIEARIVAVSRIGIHAQVNDLTGDYRQAIDRLAKLTQLWRKVRL